MSTDFSFIKVLNHGASFSIDHVISKKRCAEQNSECFYFFALFFKKVLYKKDLLLHSFTVFDIAAQLELSDADTEKKLITKTQLLFFHFIECSEFFCSKQAYIDFFDLN